ncbi:MAG: type II toxin-antitoxin system RelE/ParE family toxin [Alcaligenaceae bacterium]|nr:type II toxin-antitoxin system RelE/ParE family toxin [Alcaligenaceae bacterium SAGV5]MPS52933.1 type II toxin-antitoxin system RelE/ParE family toxin [Alcaligenaceae bacterium SAGV3]MPT59837.1 type II toxin-antitoxin system RelE/ParE family toxin [Alcaligenaceae bacterium]
MLIIKRTSQFAEWLHWLKSPSDRGAILMRLVRVQHGLFGDVRSISGGIHELRLHIGPGYRLYIAREGAEVYVRSVRAPKARRNTISNSPEPSGGT